MKRRFYILGTVIVILVLAVGSCRKAGNWLVKEDNPEHADVMVMLMGSTADRALQVSDLFRKEVSEKVLIVESSMGAYKALEERGVQLISETTQAQNALIGLGIPAENILILPGDAESTRMEAEIVREYLHIQSGIDTLLIVTSAEHTRRAFNLFRAAFRPVKEPVVLLSSPSAYTSFNSGKWWRSKEDIQEVLEEYLKLLNFVFFERRDLRRDKKETPS